MEEKAEIFLSLGSNQGIRQENLAGGLGLLIKGGFETTALSSLYETPPLYFQDQPPFLNAVVRGIYSGSPRDLLGLIAETERELGRVRTVPKGPRTLDIDILTWGRKIVEEIDLVIPHPGLSERAFVLIPLREISPCFVHPVTNLSINQLIESLNKETLFLIKRVGSFPPALL